MTDPKPPIPPSLLRYVPLALIVLGGLLGAALLRDYLNFYALAEHRMTLLAFRDSHYMLTVLVFIVAYAVIVAFSLPGATVATLTGGFLFSVFPGVLFNITAATLGAIAIFLAVRAGLGVRLAARMDAAEGAVGRLKRGLDANQWEVLFLMRLVPVVPFFVANLVPALVGVPLHRFVITTFLGIIPGGLVYTSVGAGLGELFLRGEKPNLRVILEPAVLFPILGLCALAVLPIVIKAVRGWKDA